VQEPTPAVFIFTDLLTGFYPSLLTEITNPGFSQVLIFPSLPTSLDTVASSAKHLPALPVSSL
jgi:hypothetical protein